VREYLAIVIAELWMNIWLLSSLVFCWLNYATRAYNNRSNRKLRQGCITEARLCIQNIWISAKEENRKRFPADLTHHRPGSLNYVGTNNSSSCRQLSVILEPYFVFLFPLWPLVIDPHIYEHQDATPLEFGLETRCQNRTDLC
jgi:hypothetical protein